MVIFHSIPYKSHNVTIRRVLLDINISRKIHPLSFLFYTLSIDGRI
jgi:hypothetical protein